MKARAHDPRRLDIAVLAADGSELAGQWPGLELTRLAHSQTPPQDVPPAPVRWTARAEFRAAAAGDREPWLHLVASTRAWLTCQRCLQPLEQVLEVDRWLHFVRGEAQAEALDAESEDDVLALPRWLDLRDLVEDELLLALPLVPRHSACPGALPMSVGGDLTGPESLRNPFAALESLKGGKVGKS
jgi:uncharacterized protein